MKKLGPEHLQLLRILSDGRTKTYVHITQEMGVPLTPMSPTLVNKLARPLRKAGLVKQKLGGGFVITDAGREFLHSGG